MDTKPKLVLALTSAVASPLTAELVSACGHRVVMPASEPDTLYALTRADCLLINLGSLNEDRAQLMQAAIHQARLLGKPWVLDPVGAGGSPWRSAWAQQFMQLAPSVIKGNSAEILALAGQQAKLHGIDSLNSSDDALLAAQQVARSSGAVIWVTGKVDALALPDSEGAPKLIAGGDDKMARIIGLGCALGALAALCLAENAQQATQQAHLQTLVGLSRKVKAAGKQAATQTQGLGSFKTALIDALTV